MPFTKRLLSDREHHIITTLWYTKVIVAAMMTNVPRVNGASEATFHLVQFGQLLSIHICSYDSGPFLGTRLSIPGGKDRSCLSFSLQLGKPRPQTYSGDSQLLKPFLFLELQRS